MCIDETIIEQFFFFFISECKIENCEACFSRNFCTKCKEGLYSHRGRCFSSCPEGFTVNGTMECVGESLRAFCFSSDMLCHMCLFQVTFISVALFYNVDCINTNISDYWTYSAYQASSRVVVEWWRVLVRLKLLQLKDDPLRTAPPTPTE